MKEFVIKCPECGAEYLVEEILLGDDIIGKRFAVKDSKGNIEYIEGDLPDMFSEYICDYCNAKFRVNAKVEFTTELVKDDFEEEYIVNF